MTTIQRSADCGNSPKNKAVEELAIGLETGKLDGAKLPDNLSWCGEDGNWINSRDEAEKCLKGRTAPARVKIDNVTSHGKVAAVSGTTEREGQTERFAHFIRFTSAGAKQVGAIESFRKLER